MSTPEQPGAWSGEDKYERMLALADGFDRAGEELRSRARLGLEVLADPAVSESAELSPQTYANLEQELRAASSGKRGLLSRSIELDADALVVRATVLTYRWIDELQEVAFQTLGAIAGRAIGYLAPEVNLGGALVAAGLIETDALDRESVAAYLGELAAEHPDLMEHVATGGGGLLESLQLRALLTPGMPTDDDTIREVARAGLGTLGAGAFPADAGAALRDVAGELTAASDADALAADEVVRQAPRPGSLEELMSTLESVTTSVAIRPVAPGRYIAYLPGPSTRASGRRLRLVSGDLTSYAAEAAAAIEEAVEPGAKVMVVGVAAGGATAATLAAEPRGTFTIDQVVTAGSPAAHVPRIPESTRVLSLEDRDDPVALLGSLVNAGSEHRLTVVFDSSAAGVDSRYVAGGRAADGADHPELAAELGRIRELGYLG